MNETVITLFGTIDRYWYNKNYLKYFLDKAKGQPVRLKVSSYGGDVAEAVAMSALMAEHGNVTVEFISFNASAATVHLGPAQCGPVGGHHQGTAEQEEERGSH